MKLRYLSLALVFVSILLLSGSGAYYWGSLNYFKGVLRTANPVPAAQLVAEDGWVVGEEGEVSVRLDAAPPGSVASYSIEVLYDPSLVRAVRVEPGKLWAKQNLLASEIDNELGRVSFAVGRGPGQEFTHDLTLAKIIFRPVSGGVVSIVMESGRSALSEAGDGKILPLARSEKMVNLLVKR